MFEGHDEWILSSLDKIDSDILSECLIIDSLVWYSRQTRQSGSKTKHGNHGYIEWHIKLTGKVLLLSVDSQRVVRDSWGQLLRGTDLEH